jgi:hypothetical protein
VQAILDRIGREVGAGALLDALSTRLAEARSPADVARQYRDDRFVRPSEADPRTFLTIDRLAYEAAAAFEPIELSPLAPLGTCASVAPCSQNEIVSTMRGTEVVLGRVERLALECASRRVAARIAPAP